VFEVVARANYAYPLDNRDNRRVLAVPPFMQATYDRPHRFYPGHETISPIVISPLIADRKFVIQCAFEWSPGQAGVLFAIGDNTNGLAACILDGQLYVSFSAGVANQHEISMPLVAGKQTLTLDHVAPGKRQGNATVRLSNQAEERQLNMSPTFLRLGGEGLDIGLDRKRKVSSRCVGRGAFAYPGVISFVEVTPGAQASDSLTNRPEALAQLD
jgi:hypothetical protein